MVNLRRLNRQLCQPLNMSDDLLDDIILVMVSPLSKESDKGCPLDTC